MIKKIQSTTGAKLQFEQGRDDGPGDRKCILTGKPEQCEEARERVMELIDSVQVRKKEIKTFSRKTKNYTKIFCREETIEESPGEEEAEAEGAVVEEIGVIATGAEVREVILIGKEVEMIVGEEEVGIDLKEVK